jgi:hypothetical protein
MAPVLLCPECGAKHPLDGVSGAAFPCKGCGRTLKVPQQVPTPAAVGAPPGVDPDLPWPQAGSGASTSTRVLSTTTPPEPPIPPVAPVAPPPAAAPKRPPRPSRPRDPVPPRWMRFALWIVSVPLGFIIVFGIAQIIGVLNSNQLEDVALDTGFARFMPIARLLPFVALVTAGLVQAGVYGLTRWRNQRTSVRVAAATRAPSDVNR